MSKEELMSQEEYESGILWTAQAQIFLLRCGNNMSFSFPRKTLYPFIISSTFPEVFYFFSFIFHLLMFFSMLSDISSAFHIIMELTLTLTSPDF